MAKKRQFDKSNDFTTNQSTGYIKLFRSLRKHWIWEDPIKLKWWLDILLEVNHTDNKINIGFDVIECKRGQSVKSLLNWAKDWKVDKSTVVRFFNLLKKDNMILTENLKKTIRLTVCNYDSYNDKKNDRQIILKRNANNLETQDNTNNNDKNDNNEEEIESGDKSPTPSKEDLMKKRQHEFAESLAPHVKVYGRDMIKAFYEYWSEPNKSLTKQKWELEKTWDIVRRLNKWRDNEDLFNRNKSPSQEPEPQSAAAQAILRELNR